MESATVRTDGQIHALTQAARLVGKEPAATLAASAGHAGAASALVKLAEEARVQDDESYAAAGQLLRDIAAGDSRVVEWFKPLKTAAHQTHKLLCEAESAVRAGFERARGILEPKARAYRDEQERKRREEEQRIAAELKRQQEEQRVEEAVAIEEQEGTESAAAFLEAPAPPAPVVKLPAAVPKISGVGDRTNWKFRVTNELEVPREYLVLDEPKIGRVVRALKGSTRIPGIEAYPETAFNIKRS